MNLNNDKESILNKEKELKKFLLQFKKVLVAFSGGVDSTYLISVAEECLGKDAIAVFVRGAVITQKEEINVDFLSDVLGVNIEKLDLDFLSIDQFSDNPIDRCYFCKREIFHLLLDKAEKLNCQAVLDGTNFSDEKDYRPGRRASTELNILSPLHYAKLTKEDIRFLSKRRNLPTWDKPSMPCLASRIPYGEKITPNLLRQIEEAELILHKKGFFESRVRVHNNLARIEIPEKLFRTFLEDKSDIINSFHKIGFKYLTLDIEGLRSGSLNPVQEDTYERRNN